MDLLYLVDQLEDLVASAKKMPLGNRLMISNDRILEILDELRIAIPNDVREAEELISQKTSIIRTAEEEAKLLLSTAESKASNLMEDHEIVQNARLKADQIIQQGENNLKDRINQANQEIQKRIEDSRVLAQQEMGAADNYAKQLLERLDRQLQAFVSSVHGGLEQLDRINDTSFNQSAHENNVAEKTEDVISLESEHDQDGNQVKQELEVKEYEEEIINDIDEKIVDDYSLNDFDEQK